MPADRTDKLSFLEKAGYSLGDGAANFVFMTMILFQLNFYTETMGIGAGVAGSMLLVGRLWDAFFDPMMGVLTERTKTRWGKFRPWVLWTAVPWGVIMVLAYTVPNFSMSGKVIWAILTNVLLMTLYSANNTPYSALGGVMTGDAQERTLLSSYRFVAAMIAQLVVGGFTPVLVAKFGNGDKAHGWQVTMSIWAVICVACFIITFLTTRERIQPPAEQKVEPRRDFGNLLENGPWIAMFILTLSHFIYVAMRGGVMSYFFQFYVDTPSLQAFLQGIGLPQATATSPDGGHSLMNVLGLVLAQDASNVSSVGFSFFNIVSQLTTLVGVFASAWLAGKYGKKAVALVGFIGATVFLAAFILLPANNVNAVFGLEIIRSLAYSPTIPLIWVMFADVADYAEWKTGRRTTGVIFATILFALKTGLSLGGFFAGIILSWFGYVSAGATQTPSAVLGIRLTASVFPALFLVIVCGCLVFYRITRALNAQITEELAQRRAGVSAGVSAPTSAPTIDVVPAK